VLVMLIDMRIPMLINKSAEQRPVQRVSILPLGTIPDLALESNC
jgi:hypothetical protein